MALPAKPAHEVVFRRVNEAPKKRLVLNVQGLHKCGKTNFSLTAPGPIAVHNFDYGLEGVAEKFPDKEIFGFSYGLQRTMALPGTPAGNTLADAAKQVWEEFVLNYRESLKQMKTVVVDTASEAWELLRLARLGKLTQVMPVQYTAVNSEFRELLRLALEHDCNLILLHKMKKEYLNDKPTGNYERAGFSDIGFCVQANLLVTRHDAEEGLERFKLKVLDSRHKPLAAGTEFTGANCNFPKIAATLVEGTTEDDWQ